MQSMNTPYVEPQNETVMPTTPNIISSPMNTPTQFNEPQVQTQNPTPFDFNTQAPLMDNSFQNTNTFINPHQNLNTGFAEYNQPEQPAYQPMYDNPMTPPMEPTIIPAMQDTPLFNPSAFEVPVANEPVVEQDKLAKLQDLLSTNGYAYKVYSNETDNCIIIELPKN